MPQFEFIPCEITVDRSGSRINSFLKDRNVYIITQNFGGETWGKFRTEELRKEYKNIFSITNFHFNGLFPDIRYYNELDDRLLSPLHDYNSRIIFDGFVNNKSIKDVLLDFNQQKYEEYGYFSAYEKSHSVLLQRDKYVDIKFAEEFLDRANEANILFSINHPTDMVMDAYARKIAEFFDIKINISYPTDMYVNFLSHNCNAIYREIAEYHHIKYKYIDRYIVDNVIYSIEEIIEASYKQYRQQFGKILKILSDTDFSNTPEFKNIYRILYYFHRLIPQKEPCWQEFNRVSAQLEHKDGLAQRLADELENVVANRRAACNKDI